MKSVLFYTHPGDLNFFFKKINLKKDIGLFWHWYWVVASKISKVALHVFLERKKNKKRGCTICFLFLNLDMV